MTSENILYTGLVANPSARAGALGLHPADELNALDITIVPEPSSVSLVGLAALDSLFRRRK